MIKLTTNPPALNHHMNKEGTKKYTFACLHDNTHAHHLERAAAPASNEANLPTSTGRQAADAPHLRDLKAPATTQAKHGRLGPAHRSGKEGDRPGPQRRKAPNIKHDNHCTIIS